VKECMVTDYLLKEFGMEKCSEIGLKVNGGNEGFCSVLDVQCGGKSFTLSSLVSFSSLQ